MIDLDELEAAINRCAFDGDVLGLSKAECLDMLTRLRQAEKDAARYQWLRDESNLRGVEGPLVFLTDADGEFIKNDYSCVICAEGDNLDSAIDEAMNGSNN